MESRAYDRHGRAPTASDIVFAGASATEPVERVNSVPTASDIVFAGASVLNAPPQDRLKNTPTASDIVFAGASAVSGPQKSTMRSPTASDIVFAEASDFNAPHQHGLKNTPTASDIVFGGASAVSGPQKSTMRSPTASDIVFAEASDFNAPPQHGLKNTPTALDIVFGGASAVSGPQKSTMRSPTASDIVFAEASDFNAPHQHSLKNTPTASDIVFAGASAVSGPQKSTMRAPTASDIVFAGATKVSESQKSHIDAPTASDIVFAGASKVSEPQSDSHIGTPTVSNIVIADVTKVSGPQDQHEDAPSTADNSEAQSNHSDTEARVEDSEHELTENDENGFSDDLKPIWDSEVIKSLFELFDTDDDGYLTTNDLKAFMHIWESNDIGILEILRKAGPLGRIDFPNFLILVPLLDIDLDDPLYVEEKFLDFVRARVRRGFVIGSALRKLVIRFHIYFTEKKNEDSNHEKIWESTKRLKWIFSAFDEDGDGYLTAKEVKDFMRIWEREISLVHDNRMNEVDTVWNGKIDFENFLNLLEPSDTDLIRKTEALKLVPLLNRIFCLLDEDGDGYITPKEVDTFKRIWKMNPNEVENFTEQFDFSRKETFDFPDFFNLFPLRLKSFYLIDLKEDRWSDNELRYVFNLLDEDGDGCLSMEEVKSFTRVWSMMPNEAKYIIDKVEADQNKTFNYSEFLNLLPVFEEDRFMLVDIHPSWKPVQPELITQLNHVFSSLDEDGDGRLTAKQIQSFMHVWRLQPDSVEEIVSTVDSNGHGTIDFPNFLRLLYSNDYSLKERTKDQWPTITNYIEIFTSLDEDGDGCLSCQEVAALTLMHIFRRLDLNDVRELLATVSNSDEGKIDFPSLLDWLYPRNNELAFREKSDDLVVGVRDIFTILDQDGDGYVTTKEVEIFGRLWRVSPTTFEDIKKEVDADWNGRIDLPHLFNFLYRLPGYLYDQIKQCKALIKHFEDVFDSFDEDEDGFLTTKEVETILQMGTPDANETGDTSAVAGADHNGTFDFPNFLRLLYSTDINLDKIVGKNIQIREDETVTGASEGSKTSGDDAETKGDE